VGPQVVLPILNNPSVSVGGCGGCGNH
jgi:hypothetical protein